MLPAPILPNNSKNGKVVLQFFDHIALAGSSIVLISVSVSVNWLLFSFEKVLREAEELEGGRGGSSRFGCRRALWLKENFSQIWGKLLGKYKSGKTNNNHTEICQKATNKSW